MPVSKFIDEEMEDEEKAEARALRRIGMSHVTTKYFDITGDGHDLSLASGSLLTGHADFFNAWDEDKLRTEVVLCIRRGLTCGVASNRP